MKFSEAMLLGLPEIQFMNTRFFTTNPDGSCFGCLVGAALYAVNEKRSNAEDVTLQVLIGRHWPKLAKLRFESWNCLLCNREKLREGLPGIATICTHLATHYQASELTVEQIADYIRTFEPEEDSEVTVAIVPERVENETLDSAPHR